jgi:hypothetical protein
MQLLMFLDTINILIVLKKVADLLSTTFFLIQRLVVGKTPMASIGTITNPLHAGQNINEQVFMVRCN